MHPPLHRSHPDCQGVITALEECHKNNPYLKFFGECNDDKAALDHCFRAEKHRARKANMEKAREGDRRWAEVVAMNEKMKKAADGGGGGKPL
jgi:COX assembly protein 2